MITISGELIQGLAETAGAHRVPVTCWDDGDAYTILDDRAAGTSWTGTIHFATDVNGVDVSLIGAPEDCVRIIAKAVAPDAASRESDNGDAPLDVRGYARRDGHWRETPVQVVPIRSQLFSRLGGLLETGILAGKRVFLAGLGSGGAPTVIELAKAGVTLFDILDHDRLEVANVARHLAGLPHVGRHKTKFMADAIREKNPYAEVRTYEVKVSWKNLELIRRLVREADLVICATDSRESKIILNKLCVAEKKTLIIAGAFRRAYGGQILRIWPGVTLCFQCFLEAMPDKALDQEISGAEAAERLAYTDRPVPVEPGLSTDIAPISLMVTKLAIQELLRGQETTLDSLHEDLVAPWYLWLNRREQDTDYAKLEPLEFNIGGMHVLRWYGVAAQRNPACPVCGDFVGEMAKKHGLEVSPDATTPVAAERAREFRCGCQGTHISGC